MAKYRIDFCRTQVVSTYVDAEDRREALRIGEALLDSAEYRREIDDRMQRIWDPENYVEVDEESDYTWSLIEEWIEDDISNEYLTPEEVSDWIGE